MTNDNTPQVLNALAQEISIDNIGVYPMKVIDKQGNESKRTDWQEGWNACLAKIHERMDKSQDFLKTLPGEIINYLVSEKLYVHMGKDTPQLWVCCNDLFHWATADGEDFTIKDLKEYKKAWKQSPAFGDLLWVCRKRGMRPQEDYYKFFDDKEIKLFNDCGPARDDE